MNIFLNGQLCELPHPMTVAELLSHLGHADRRIAVEVNRAIVPRSRHAQHALEPQDRVELVEAFGGG
jgi:sulfur carrier protein